jgi:hypothetical protein
VARKGEVRGIPEGKIDHLVDTAVDGKIILKWIFKAWDVRGMNWINLTQDRDKHSRRWEDNIKMDLQDRECGGKDWIDLGQDRDKWRAIVNTVMNLRVP